MASLIITAAVPLRSYDVKILLLLLIGEANFPERNEQEILRVFFCVLVLLSFPRWTFIIAYALKSGVSLTDNPVTTTQQPIQTPIAHLVVGIAVVCPESGHLDRFLGLRNVYICDWLLSLTR